MIHITTHGEYEQIGSTKRSRFSGFATPHGTATIDDIRNADIDLSGKTVMSRACYSGQKTPRKAFKDATNCKHYIAPIKDPHFHNAALMCHIFYHKHPVLNKSVKKAFSEYEDRYKNPHTFRPL